MTELNQVYKCNVCGNIVEVVHPGQGSLVCCNQPMVLFKENTVDAAKEKHVPVLTRVGNIVTVKLGSVEHPMEEKHYIEWVEIIDGGKVSRQYLKPGEKPEAKFNVDGPVVTARGFCNLHGLWSSQE